MLIAFALKNFRSFLGEQIFTYCSSADKSLESTHCVKTGLKSVPRLSKAAIIFGPNGSGKSNLIAALETLRELVLNSTASSAQRFADFYTPFKLGQSTNQPTQFDIEILLSRIRYRYSVSYDAQRICSERLSVYRTRKAQRWYDRRFDRATDTMKWAPFSPHLNGPRETWRKATRPSSLFLSTAAQLNSPQLRPIFDWFEHCLDIVQLSRSGSWSSVVRRLSEPAFKSSVLRFLRSVDIHVDDVRVAEADLQPSAPAVVTFPPSPRAPAALKLEFLHSRRGASPVWLPSDHESAGAQRLIGLLGSLLATFRRNKLLVVDDFDVNLHPMVARFLIQLVTSPVTSHLTAQLLLVSHNTTLMDLDMLRRDEIWLTELKDGGTHLNTVARSSPRRGERIAKGYLRGRYGALPSIKPELASIVSAPAESKSAGSARGKNAQ